MTAHLVPTSPLTLPSHLWEAVGTWLEAVGVVPGLAPLPPAAALGRECSRWWAARGQEVEVHPRTVGRVLAHRGHVLRPYRCKALWRARAREARALWEVCGVELPAESTLRPPSLPALTWATAPGGVRRPVVDALLQVYPSPEAAAAWCGWAEVPRDERRPVQADLARCLLREARWPEWVHRGARGVLRAAESGRPWGGRLWRLMAPGEVVLVPPATPVGGRLPGVEGWWVC